MVVKQIDLSFVTREEYESATRCPALCSARALPCCSLRCHCRSHIFPKCDRILTFSGADVRREAKLLSSLSHPNVIRFHDEFVDDELLHIVMEFAPYGTLKQNLAKMTGLIPESSAAWILLNIMNGIDFLHQRKIVHRDLKSENIFIGQDHVPKVGDFGVATRLNSAQPMAVSVVGTPLYLSPELCNGAPYDTKSDIWAAGVLMYEVCSMGRLPFAAGNQGAVINKILTGHFAPLSPQYSAEMHRMLGECLRQSPSERPTAHVLHQRLSALRHSDVTKESATAEPAASQAAPAVAGQGADHFSLVPHEAEPQRTNSEPMWWEWASKNGFVTGQFRTLYGGTPHHSPSGAAVDRTPGAKHGHSRRRGGGEMPRGGDRSHVDGGSTGSILPFSRERYRPTSAPSTPSSAGSPAAPGRRKGNGQDDLLGYLVSTPGLTVKPVCRNMSAGVCSRTNTTPHIRALILSIRDAVLSTPSYFDLSTPSYFGRSDSRRPVAGRGVGQQNSSRRRQGAYGSERGSKAGRPAAGQCRAASLFSCEVRHGPPTGSCQSCCAVTASVP